jgi:hypothetical protein
MPKPMEKQHPPRRRKPGSLSTKGVSSVLWLMLIVFVWFKVKTSFAHFRNVQQEFHAVSKGLPASWVKEKFGKPTVHDGKCGVVVSASSGCKLEYVYGHPFTPLTQDYYVVEFDSDKLVMSMQHVNRQ